MFSFAPCLLSSQVQLGTFFHDFFPLFSTPSYFLLPFLSFLLFIFDYLPFLSYLMFAVTAQRQLHQTRGLPPQAEDRDGCHLSFPVMMLALLPHLPRQVCNLHSVSPHSWEKQLHRPFTKGETYPVGHQRPVPRENRKVEKSEFDLL